MRIRAHKIKDKGRTGKIGRWILDFLTNRKQVVTANGAKSGEITVKSSVPQGTVLAPALFLIYIDDIGQELERRIDIRSFADDTSVGNSIQSEDDHILLQQSIDRIYGWTENNNMQFNSRKFQVLRFGKNEELKQLRYTTSDLDEIQDVEHAVSLGVTFSNDGTFKEHINKTILKCKRKSSFILRSFRARDEESMLTLWKSQVVSKIDYGAPLTNAATQDQRRRIEGLQKAIKTLLSPETTREIFDHLHVENP